MTRHAIPALLAFSMFLLASCLSSKENSEGTILPSQNPPPFVKAQWEEMVTKGQFPLPKRDWQEVGLPPGLEEQVWEAWAPGAKPHWKNISPGYTNVIYDAKVDNGVITFVLDGFGLVQSKDGGRTWGALSHHLTNSGVSIGYYSFDVSPSNPEIVAVTGANIDYTLNGGRSWSPVMDQALPPFKSMLVIQGKPCRAGAMSFGFIRFNADGSKVFSAPGGFGHDFRQRNGIETEMAGWLKHKLIYAGDGKVSNFKAIDLGPFAAIRFILPHFSNPDLVYASFSDGSIYICRNARAENPVFTELARPALLNDLQAIWMDVSPNDPSSLLLTMSDASNKAEWNKSKIVLAKVSGDTLDCKEIQVGAKDENPLSFASARWNPRNPEQVFVGIKWGQTALRISDDGMKTFRKQELPKDLFPEDHTTGYACPRSFALDRKSDLSVVYSVTGVWSSHDEFKNVEEAVMTHDYDRKLYGNKGVGFAECGMSICIRKNYSYLTTNDHGAWRSNGQDTSKWHKISDNPGMPRPDSYRLAWPLAVSEDESCLLLSSHMKDWSDKKHKLMISKDKGDTWQDITTRLGLGDVIEGGIARIFFDPTNAKTAWILADDKFFVTTDGCETFKNTGTSISRHLPSAYDPVHKTLYAPAKDSKIKRSVDMGFTWTDLPRTFSGIIHGLDVLENGDLVVGDDGRLLVIPFDKIESGNIEPSMIRLTIGDSLGATACGLRTFKPVICRGKDIIAFTNNGWNHSNAVRDLGPLLSRDGGKTFQWIVYDLSCTEPAHALDMRDGKIIIGNRGIHELNLK